MTRALWLAAALAVAAAPVGAQPVDSLRSRAEAPVVAGTPASSDTTGRPTPRGAVTRALALPGLGQIYVGQPAKAPFAFAFVAGAATYFAIRQREYVLYRRAAVVAGCLQDDGTAGDTDDPDRIALCADADAQYRDEYDAVNEGLTTPAGFTAISTARNSARGQRDIGGLVVLAAYALQALDAYVAAELSDFDVSEDLSLSVQPGPGPARLALRLEL